MNLKFALEARAKESDMPALYCLPNNKTTRLRNTNCVYCGCIPDAKNPSTLEHIIGRNFVPKGSFSSGWSLHASACDRCNGEKSDLENDISAITLIPDIGNQHSDANLAQLAINKAKGSISRLTKKSVKDSYQEDKITFQPMQSVDINFGLIAPPQVDPARVRRLAQFHLQGFYFLTTYNLDQKVGCYIPDKFLWLNEARRPDWGNSLQYGFADLTLDWPIVAEGVGANGFFKIAIRRDPANVALCSFALEWNGALRIIGFFGDLDPAKPYVASIPQLVWKQKSLSERIRSEVSLDANKDRLFNYELISLTEHRVLIL